MILYFIYVLFQGSVSRTKTAFSLSTCEMGGVLTGTQPSFAWCRGLLQVGWWLQGTVWWDADRRETERATRGSLCCTLRALLQGHACWVSAHITPDMYHNVGQNYCVLLLLIIIRKWSLASMYACNRSRAGNNFIPQISENVPVLWPLFKISELLQYNLISIHFT